MRDDWVSPWWQVTLLPERWNVAGVRVPPLSVWHHFALEQLENPWICGGKVCIDDCACLLLVAQHDYRRGKRLMLAENYRMRQIVRVHDKIKKVDFEHVLRACDEYVNTCVRVATRMRRQNTEYTPCGSPEAYAIIATLKGYAKIEDLWNMPYGQARALMDACDERAGNATLTPHSYGEYMVDHWDDIQSRQNETQELHIG